jgi:ERF superfamily
MVVLFMSHEQFFYQVDRQQEESMKSIYSAFIKAQKEFAPALKTSTNPHFKSRYVSLDGCIEAVIDALNNNGIGLVQKTHEMPSGIKVETLLIHESGESLSGGELFLPASKQDAQGFGSALTYARRYSLMATCGIAPEDDDGNAAVAGQINPQRFIDQLKACKTLDELASAYKAIYPQISNNAVALRNVTTVKDQLKSELGEQNGKD